MRVGEVLALEWLDIGDDSITVSKSISEGKITSTKTANIRVVPLFDSLKSFIEAQKLESGHDFQIRKAIIIWKISGFGF